MNLFKAMCVGAALCLAAGVVTAEAKPDLTGVWVLNAEASEERVTTRKKGGSGLGTSVSVGGIGIPLPGSSTPSGSGTKLKDPDVLFCQQMEIRVEDEIVVLHYEGLGEEKMRPGKHQGKKVRWTGKKLTESYETTSRRVSKTYELTGPDQMKVTVRLNPNQGDTRTYSKVFDRAVAPAPDDSASHAEG